MQTFRLTQQISERYNIDEFGGNIDTSKLKYIDLKCPAPGVEMKAGKLSD